MCHKIIVWQIVLAVSEKKLTSKKSEEASQSYIISFVYNEKLLLRNYI